MKPGIDQQLMAMTAVLATKIAPAIPEENYAAGDAGMVAMVLMMLAQEVDRRADTLWREIRAMRHLFADMAAHPLPEGLHGALAEAAQGEETSLRLSALEARHSALSTLLIALHAHVEGLSEPWVQNANRRIWDFLEQAAEDRVLVMPAM